MRHWDVKNNASFGTSLRRREKDMDRVDTEGSCSGVWFRKMNHVRQWKNVTSKRDCREIYINSSWLGRGSVYISPRYSDSKGLHSWKKELGRLNLRGEEALDTNFECRIQSNLRSPTCTVGKIGIICFIFTVLSLRCWQLGEGNNTRGQVRRRVLNFLF